MRTYFNQIITSLTSNGEAEALKTYNRPILNSSEPDTHRIVTVDKFKMNLSSIPLMIFNPAVNYYTLELVCGAASSGVVSLGSYFVSHAQYPGILPSSEYYYYIYYYSQFIQILNRTLAAAYAVIAGAVPANNAAPFFNVDTNGILHLFTSHSFIEGAANQIYIYVNGVLSYEYFDGMPKISLTASFNNLLPSGRDARLVSYNNYVNEITLTGGQLMYDQSTNSGPDTCVKWNVCKGVVITSNLDTRQEGFPEGESSNLFYSSSINSTEILVNFSVIYNNIIKPIQLDYSANSLDRFIEILNNNSQIEMGIKFYWYDKTHKLYKITIQRDDVCSVRFVFDDIKDNVKSLTHFLSKK